MKKTTAWSKKPFVLMDDIELTRAWDRLFKGIEEALLQEARGGKRVVVVAVALFVSATGERRVLFANEEAGDGEGKAPAEHVVARAKKHLKDGEAVRLEFVDVLLGNNGTWSSTLRQGRARRHARLESIWTDASIKLDIAKARRDREDIFLSVVVLTNARRERRVALANCEFCDPRARQGSAELIRRARRLNLLRRGERLDRVRVHLSNRESSWVVRSRPDPVRGEV